MVVLTGAGVSAESGVATFRGAGGLWEGHHVEEVATPEAFARDPVLVQRFYDMRRAGLKEVGPNAAHKALAKLDEAWPHSFLLVTQNVDDLHERAGSERMLHMHGELNSVWCLGCDSRHEFTGALLENPPCPDCGETKLRPDIVWFGEMPYHMETIEDALMGADLFISIGTSGNVYPAAGFVDLARRVGAHTVEVNLDPSMRSDSFHDSRIGPAGELVPELVEEILAGLGGE